MKNALTSLPDGLNNTYDETIDRIDSQHPDHAILARKVLYWVFYAFRPLTMLELQHALAVETGDTNLDEDNIPEEEMLLSVCNGLVTYEKEGDFLALVHYTFQQYLEHKAESLFPEAQVDIVRTCLTYLSFDEFEQGPCHEDQDFRVRLKRWPLLRYAVPKWGQHARQGAEEACRDLITSFLSQTAKFSASVQVVWVRESMGVNYARRFPSAVSALWLASLYGLEYTVRHLLASQRQSVGRKTTWGDTALHRAASCGSVEILESLLKNGAEINAKDHAGNTSLHLASFFWADIFFTSMTPVSWGWMAHNARTLDMSLKVTRSLLDHGADVNAVNLQGDTALHRSIMKGEKSMTNLLLARGADITIKDGHRAAPLTLVSESGDEEVARILLRHDLERQIQCGVLDDAMRMSASKDHLALLEMLLARSSEQPTPDPEGKSLLHISAYGGSLKCLQYLENHGFDLRALDKQKRTCLHSAAAGRRPGSCAVLEYLLEGGLDPSQSDVDGWTTLLWAAKAGNIDKIRVLLDAGAARDFLGVRKWTPFAVAVFHGNILAVGALRPDDEPVPENFNKQHLSFSLLHPDVCCDGCELVSISHCSLSTVGN